MLELCQKSLTNEFLITKTVEQHWNICYYLIVTVIEILVLFMETTHVTAREKSS